MSYPRQTRVSLDHGGGGGGVEDMLGLGRGRISDLLKVYATADLLQLRFQRPIYEMLKIALRWDINDLWLDKGADLCIEACKSSSSETTELLLTFR